MWQINANVPNAAGIDDLNRDDADAGQLAAAKKAAKALASAVPNGELIVTLAGQDKPDNAGPHDPHETITVTVSATDSV